MVLAWIGFTPTERVIAQTAALQDCTVPRVEMRSWTQSTVGALGFSFRHPESYREKEWASSSPGAPTGSDWWHDNGPAWTFQFTRRPVMSDSVRHATYARLTGYHQCSLHTPAGRAIVELFRNGTAGYGAHAVLLYNAVIDWPPGPDGESLHMEATSRDLPRLLEQLAIAPTVARQ